MGGALALGRAARGTNTGAVASAVETGEDAPLTQLCPPSDVVSLSGAVSARMRRGMAALRGAWCGRWWAGGDAG